jgi:hypothetical protein
VNELLPNPLISGKILIWHGKCKIVIIYLRKKVKGYEKRVGSGRERTRTGDHEHPSQQLTLSGDVRGRARAAVELSCYLVFPAASGGILPGPSQSGPIRVRVVIDGEIRTGFEK